jgi:hypothetical protein
VTSSSTSSAESLRMNPSPESLASLRLVHNRVQFPNDKTGKVLEAVLEFAPSASGRRNVAVEINSCIDDEQLAQLAERYIHGLIVPSKFKVVDCIHCFC